MKKARRARAIAIPNGWQGRSGFPRGTHNKDNQEAAFTKLVEQNRIDDVSGSMELDFYRAHFSDALAEKNSRYTEKGRPERVQTVEDLYIAPKTAPEEIIWQIETKEHGTIELSLLEAIIAEHFAWERAAFPLARYFSHAVHRIEKAALDYIHARRIWIAHDKAGNEIISERKALREMGIERPDKGQKETRHNNAKTSYTVMCCAHLKMLFDLQGLDIAITLWKRGKHGLTPFFRVPLQ